MPHEDAGPPRRVVIVGGGFAGVGCAKRLAGHDDVHVTLIDRNNYHQFQPLLYQVATSQLASSDIAYSLRKLFHDQENVDVKLAEIASVDPAARTVHTTDGQTYEGDALVLAAGSQPNFFRTPGADEHAFPLYCLDDATRLRSRIIGAFEEADRDPSRIDKGALNFVVIGGGATGGGRAERRGDGRRAGGDDPRHDDRRVPRPGGDGGAGAPRRPWPRAARPVLRA